MGIKVLAAFIEMCENKLFRAGESLGQCNSKSVEKYNRKLINL